MAIHIIFLFILYSNHITLSKRKYKKNNLSKIITGKSFRRQKSLGPKSPWTIVPLEFAPLEKGILGPLSFGQIYQHHSIDFYDRCL